MALIKCPECRKKISDQCDNCPHCGYPVKANIEDKVQVEEKIEINDVVEKKKEAIIPKKLLKERKPINKKKLVIVISVVVALLVLGSIIGYNLMLPRINATRDYKKVVKMVEEKNSDLEKAIVKSEKLINKKQPLLDETLLPALENAISDAKAVKVTDFKIPRSVDDIISKTKKLKAVDYTEALNNLKEKHNALDINAKRYQLVNQPTEAYVIQCLQTIPEIVNISAVTEDNDPNGNLNKAGGYTATVYFAHKSIQLDTFVYGETLIEQGTDAGGGVEVYTCVEDAVKRRDYLAAFDGGIFASGTHTVIGTVLVRTSNELTASQQKELEAKLIAALTYLPEVDAQADNANEQQQVDNQVTNESSTAQETSQPTNQEGNKSENKKTTSTSTNQYTAAVTVAYSCYNANNSISPSEVRNHMSEYYSSTEIEYALKNSGIDWNNAARNRALQCIDEYKAQGKRITAYDIIDKLSALGFSDDSITYAIDNTDGYDKGIAEEPAERAKRLHGYGYSREEIIQDFMSGGWSREDAERLVNDCGIQ